MNENELAAAKRRNTIAWLVESMRAAQRQEIQKHTRAAQRGVVIQLRPRQVGVWKGGC